MKLMALLFEPRSFFTSPVSSYTLFGALCWRYLLLFGEKKLQDFLSSYEERPPLLISSPIFYLKGEFYFPLPILPSEYFSEDKRREIEKKRVKEEGQSLRKKIKVIRYIPLVLLKKVLSGEIKTMTTLVEHIKDFLPSLQVVEPQRGILVRNRLNRLTNTTAGGELFNLPCLLYPSFVVLFLLFENCPLTPELLLTLFSRVSLGGKKSSGLGKVKVSLLEDRSFLGEITSFLSSPSKKFYTLSPVFYDKSFDLANSYYHLFTFTGIIDNYYFSPLPTIIKKRVVYFSPGSIFTLVQDQTQTAVDSIIFGKLKIVNKDPTKNINIYQYGYAFPLFIRNT